ncbi:MAG: enterochelin esterase [Bdellovibrio sp.]|nr:MAG: enterochelin esterase [Bdellovibrio sp.]
MLKDSLYILRLKHFEIKTLEIKSQCLKKNPLGDPSLRLNPLLVPKVPRSSYPVILVLSGFTGNGPKYFGPKSFEKNFPETLDFLVAHKKAPTAIYVFVDAMTFWGGSQFINSKGCGAYEDYIIQELVPAIKHSFPTSSWCVMGGSSGGYGALHLSTKYPKIFSVCGALAPDSFFESSLLPEFYTALPYIKKYGGIKGIKKLLKKEELFQKKHAHTIINAIAMGLCYAPHPHKKDEVLWPIDPQTGQLNKNVWKVYKKFDPLSFLPRRKKALQQIHFYLDVGIYDQFHLQYGARQIKKIFEKFSASYFYSEFNGNHFDLHLRREPFFKWLKSLWDQKSV